MPCSLSALLTERLGIVVQRLHSSFAILYGLMKINGWSFECVSLGDMLRQSWVRLNRNVVKLLSTNYLPLVL